jgi:hypothetical protein
MSAHFKNINGNLQMNGLPKPMRFYYSFDLFRRKKRIDLQKFGM